MSYPDQFHRLVVIGKAYTDTVNFSCAIVPTGFGGTSEPSQGLVDSVFNFVQTWWVGAGANDIGIAASHVFMGIKLNRIGTDGRYADPVTHEKYHAGSGNPGGFSAYPPAQLATVLTLRTAVERGHASKGRMYLPPVSGYIGPLDTTTGQASLAASTRVATAGRALILGIHAAYAANGLAAARVGVTSDIGGGTIRPVTAVSAGRVPDTMRSRRSKLQEAPYLVVV